MNNLISFEIYKFRRFTRHARSTAGQNGSGWRFFMIFDLRIIDAVFKKFKTFVRNLAL